MSTSRPLGHATSTTTRRSVLDEITTQYQIEVADNNYENADLLSFGEVDVDDVLYRREEEGAIRYRRRRNVDTRRRRQRLSSLETTAVSRFSFLSKTDDVDSRRRRRRR